MAVRMGMLAAGLFLVAGGGVQAASDGVGAAAYGQRLAEELCSECHIVAPGEADHPDLPGPSLPDRIRDPGMTATALRVYMQTAHPTMPNIRLSPEQMDDLVAYLDTLREGEE